MYNQTVKGPYLHKPTLSITKDQQVCLNNKVQGPEGYRTCRKEGRQVDR